MSLVICPDCDATRSEEIGCATCRWDRLEARGGDQGPTADELENEFLRAQVEMLARAIGITQLFRIPRGEA